MEELHKIIKNKYKNFNITPQHLGQVIRNNNITIKRTLKNYFDNSYSITAYKDYIKRDSTLKRKLKLYKD